MPASVSRTKRAALAYSLVRLQRRPQPPQLAQLPVRGRLGLLHVLRYLKRPAGLLASLLDRHPGMHLGEGQLASLGVRPKYSEVGDHDRRALAGHREAGPIARRDAVADRRPEVQPFDEAAPRLTNDHDH